MAGRWTGSLQWLRFHLAEGVIYDTGAANTPAFGKQFHVLEAAELAAGAPVEIRARRDEQHTWFWATPGPPVTWRSSAVVGLSSISA